MWRWEFLDEVGYLSPEELASLIVACHEVAQRNLPLLFVGAGLRRLPPLPAMQNPMPSAFSPILKWANSTLCPPAQRLFTQRRTKALISKTMRSKKFCA